MDPAPEGGCSSLLCAPLPWTEDGHIEAALMVFESQTLAEAGLEHYLVRTAPERSPDSSHFIMPLTPEELIDIL